MNKTHEWTGVNLSNAENPTNCFYDDDYEDQKILFYDHSFYRP